MLYNRRSWLQAGGLALAGLMLPGARGARGNTPVTVLLRSDAAGGRVGFDPIGLYLEPGRTVRWINQANVHTVTAYHPANDRHSLRIPERAESWDSGYLIEPGAQFEHRFTVPGVYDYFCIPHEAAGMVGRIVVGAPGGPGTRPFDYFHALPHRPAWRDVPAAARRRFPAIEAILRVGRVAG